MKAEQPVLMECGHPDLNPAYTVAGLTQNGLKDGPNTVGAALLEKKSLGGSRGIPPELFGGS